jgi:hypothetical protein
VNSFRHPAFDVADHEEGEAPDLGRIREEALLLQSQNDLRAVMSIVEGRRFVWGLLEDCGVFAPSFANEPLATSYNEGRRAIGIGLMVRCQAEATDLYIAALQEHLAEVKKTAETRQALEASAQERQ